MAVVDGRYELSVDATGTRDVNGAVGVGTSSIRWTLDTTAPRVLEVESLATNPRNIVVQALEVSLSEDIDLSTLTRDDLRLTRDGGNNLIDDRVTVEHVFGGTYRVRGINWVVGVEGEYQFTIVGAGVRDKAGNAGFNSALTTWVMDTTPPTMASELQVIPKAPYFDWARSLEGGLPDSTDTWTSVYLVKADEEDVSVDVLRRNYAAIFDEQLESWHLEMGDWPQNRDFEMFQQWFEAEAVDLVIDLSEGTLMHED